MKTIEEQNLYNYLRSDLNTLSDMSFDIAMNNYLKTSITNDNPIFNNIKNRYDIFVSNLNTDTFRTLFVVQVPNNKNSNVIIQSRADKRYYKEESFDKFMRMYKKICTIYWNYSIKSEYYIEKWHFSKGNGGNIRKN